MLPNKFSSPWMGARNRYGISELQRKLQPQQHIETCLLEHGFLMKLQGFNTNLKFTTDDADESDDMLKKVSWYRTVKCRLNAPVRAQKSLHYRGPAPALHVVHLGAVTGQIIRLLCCLLLSDFVSEDHAVQRQKLGILRCHPQGRLQCFAMFGIISSFMAALET